MTEPIKDLMKTLKDSGIWVQRATCSVAAENKPCLKVSLPVKPATSQSGLASLFSLLLPSMYRRQFQISSRKPPKEARMMKKAPGWWRKLFTRSISPRHFPRKSPEGVKLLAAKRCRNWTLENPPLPTQGCGGTAKWVQGTFLQNNGPGPPPSKA